MVIANCPEPWVLKEGFCSVHVGNFGAETFGDWMFSNRIVWLREVWP
jgi:hypothetical protein